MIPFSCAFERFRDLLGDGQRFFDRYGSIAFHALCSVSLGNQFHDQGMRGAGLFEAVDRGNVGMIQRRQHFRFALKTRDPLAIMRHCFRQDFDGHVAPELGVLRLIHLAHAARANLRADFVGANLRPY